MQNQRMTGPGHPPQYPIESVDNALRLILLLGEQPELRLSDAAVYLGVATSTAHRLMAMLVWRGFVRQNPKTKAYEPGAALTNVAFTILRKMDMPALAQPILDEVSAATNETSHLGRLEGDQIRFLTSSEPDVAVRVSSRLGKNLPAHCTSTGKVLLATLTFEQFRTLYPREKLSGVTGSSIRSRTELEAELERIRERGFAVNREESEDGVGSVAVAVPSEAQHHVAINVAVPMFRLTDKKIEECGTVLRVAAKKLLALIG